MKAVGDGLRRLDGVDSIQADLQANLVTIHPRTDVALALAEVPGAIERSGFRPGRLWIRADGGVEALPDGSPGFRIGSWTAPYALEGASPAGPGPHDFEVLLDGAAPRLRLAPLPGA